jgi:outer membrane protein OmpA-like peptidoglycan-associated protein
MTRIVLSAGLVAATFFSGACATKTYVRNTAAPIQAKVDQVGEEAQKQGQEIQQTQTDVKGVDERATSGIGAANEKAGAAQGRADEAMNRATQANDLAGKDSEEIRGLRQFVSNLDDYKQVSDLRIPFAFNKSTLTAKDQEDLDKMVASASANKRYFIAVEGFTDRVGSRQYNETLSRKRADAVVEYLVAKHDIPIYRIHMIGLADAKPVDAGHGSAARAKNRRVEVKIFSSDESYALSQLRQEQATSQQQVSH